MGCEKKAEKIFGERVPEGRVNAGGWDEGWCGETHIAGAEGSRGKE